MTANISTFISKFKNTELSRPCNFDVLIAPTTSLFSTLISPSVAGKVLQAKLKSKGGELKFKCEAAELPMRTFGIAEQKTYGPTERTPIQNAYEPITLSFICSDDMNEKYFFDLWMEVISVSNPIGIATGAISSALESIINLGGGVRFDFEYKDNYTSTIIITQYDLTGKPSYKIALIEAFPFSVSQMGLNWSSTDEYHRVRVGFYYKYFTILPL